MLPKEIYKYVLDIDSMLNELDQMIQVCESNFDKFAANFILVRAVERDLMIIGEAIGKMLKLKEDLKISGAKQIIGFRNIIVHAYDAIDVTVLWKILIKDLPFLREEIDQIKGA